MPGTTYDVAVIGAGVFGAWTAFFLQRAGLRVILVDQYGPGNSRSSSGGETRIIRMGYGNDEIYSRWSLRSLELWKGFSTGFQSQKSLDPHGSTSPTDGLFLPTGMLWLANADDAYTLATTATLTRLGIHHLHFDRHELELRYPQIAFGRHGSALYEPQGGTILARRAVQAIVSQAIARGVKYEQDVVEVKLGSMVEAVTTSNGNSIRAKQFVFACGAWLPKLLPELLEDFIHPTRQEVYFFGVPPGDSRFEMPALPAWIDFPRRFYGVPDIEHRGMKIGVDRHGALIDLDRDDRLINLDNLTEIREYIAERFPGLKDAPLVESRVCQYENTPNGDFLIDRHPDYENVWLVGGGSGHGFKHGPAVGEYVSALITGPTEMEPRFTLAGRSLVRQRSIF